MILKAPGKINLALDVINKRDDGYHNIDTVSIPIALHDCLEITELIQGNETYLTCDDLSLVCDESNLAIQAYRAMQENFGLKRPFRIEIYKRIPIEAGLAGGSADAAAVMRAVSRYLKPVPTFDRLAAVGAAVGSDVPFCLLNKPSRVQGRGEILTPVSVKKAYHVLIVKPRQGLSTEEVYAVADGKTVRHPDIEALIDALKTGDEPKIAANLINSLEEAAISLCPAVADILGQFKLLGFRMYSMSGSGSACFALAEDVRLLQYSAKFFASKGYKTYLTSFNI